MRKDELKQMEIQDALCSARWVYPLVDFSKSEVRTCCRTRGERVTSEQIDRLGTDIFLNTEYQLERRLEMLKGQRHSACETCWISEEAGVQSARFTTEYIPYPWVKAEDGSKDFSDLNLFTELRNSRTGEIVTPNDVNLNSSILRAEDPHMLEINLSNTCDLKCSYCGPYFSSKWEKELELWALGAGFKTFNQVDEDYLKNDIRKDVNDRFLDTFWEWFNGKPVRTLSRIGIIGGEPLINPMLPEFLDNLIAAYSRIPLLERPNSGFKENGTIRDDNKPLIWFVTNLNTPKKIMDRFISEQLPKLTEIFHVQIHASLESVGKRIEYTRDGLSWETYKENVERLCAVDLPNYNFGFQIALNSLSMTTLTEFLRYAKYLHDRFERSIILKHNVVSFPEFHHPAVLPKRYAEYVKEALNFLEEVKDQMRPVEDEWGSWPTYYEYIKTIHKSIFEEQGKAILWRLGSIDDVKVTFYRFFTEYDKKRGTNFFKTFPEYIGFYNECKEIYEASVIKEKRGVGSSRRF